MAPFGYGVTNAPVNLNTQWAMYPYNMTSNYGLETQHYLIPSYASPLEAYLTRDLTNRNGISQVNPMLFGFNLGGQQDNGASQAALMKSYQDAYQLGQQSRVMSSFKSSFEALNSLHERLSGLTKSDKLDNSQKDRVKALITKIEAMQKRIQNIKTPSLEEAEAVQGEIIELQKEISELSKALSEEIESGKSDGSKKTEETDDADGTDKTDDAKDDKKSEAKGPASKRSKKENEDLDFALTQVCHKIDKAIDSCGTNYDDDENGLLPTMKNNVDSDNVLELFNAWDKTYSKVSDYADDGDGFIESLMDDCGGDQKETIATILIDALEKRAHENGTDVTAEVGTARSAIKSNFFGYRDDDDIQTAVNALRDKVAKAEKSEDKKDTSKTDESKKTDNTKKEADQKKAIEDKKAEFIEDMKEILERDDIKALPAGLEVVTDDKGNFKCFKIRIKGKNYEGKDYLDLVGKLEKDDKTLPVK